MSTRSLAAAAALALLAGVPRPSDAQDLLTASYSGALSFSGPDVRITAAVTNGRVLCAGTLSTGDGVISYAGIGKIDLELGLSTQEDDQGPRLTDLYRITLHCPTNADRARSLSDIANTGYQPGGSVSRSGSTGGLVGPELLKGVWRENDEEFSWDLCRSNCRAPPAAAPPAAASPP